MLDDFSRYIVAWKLCTTMKAEDVTATLDLVLQASGLDQAKPADRPKLLSDNGSSYVAGDLAKWLGARSIKHLRGAPLSSDDPGQDRAGTRPSRTASCWKTTSCQAISRPRSKPSSPTTITGSITRASTISPPPTSTSDAGLLSWQNEKGSNDRPSLTNRRLQHQLHAA